MFLLFTQKFDFSKKSFLDIIRQLNSLDTDQARHHVGPDLDPNCLQWLSADDTCRHRVKCINVLESCHSKSYVMTCCGSSKRQRYTMVKSGITLT